MHLENPRTISKLSTTPVDHYEVDLVSRTRHAAGVDSLDKLPGRTVTVWTKDRTTPKRDGPQP